MYICIKRLQYLFINCHVEILISKQIQKKFNAVTTELQVYLEREHFYSIDGI